jgi:hypothetical protein
LMKWETVLGTEAKAKVKSKLSCCSMVKTEKWMKVEKEEDRDSFI